MLPAGLIVLIGFLLLVAAAAWEFGALALLGGGVVALAVGLFALDVGDSSA